MSETYDYIEVKIPAKPEHVGVVRLTLSGIASRMGFSYEAIEDIKVSVSEAITNAVQHAYLDKEGDVQIGFALHADKLEVMVTDHGESFNFQQARMETGPYQGDEQAQNLREGGLGLYLIESLMDDVKVLQHDGVTVFMTKYLEKEQVDRDVKPISTTD